MLHTQTSTATRKNDNRLQNHRSSSVQVKCFPTCNIEIRHYPRLSIIGVFIIPNASHEQITCPPSTPFPQENPPSYLVQFLFHRHRLRQVARKIYVKTFAHGEPVRYELQGNHIEESLKAVDGLGNLDFLGFLCREFLVVGIADYNGSAASGNDCFALLVNRAGFDEATATNLADKHSATSRRYHRA